MTSRMKYPVCIGLALSLMMTLAGFQTRVLADHDDDDCCCPRPIISQPVCCPAPAPVISCPAPAPVVSCPAGYGYGYGTGYGCGTGYGDGYPHRRLHRRAWNWFDD